MGLVGKSVAMEVLFYDTDHAKYSYRIRSKKNKLVSHCTGQIILFQKGEIPLIPQNNFVLKEFIKLETSVKLETSE